MARRITLSCICFEHGYFWLMKFAYNRQQLSEKCLPKIIRKNSFENNLVFCFKYLFLFYYKFFLDLVKPY